MPNSPRLALAVLAALMSASCTSWEVTKREVVTPVNQLVHRDYPAAFKRQDVEAVVSYYSPELRDWGQADAREILERFDRVDRSRCVIHNASAPDSLKGIFPRETVSIAPRSISSRQTLRPLPANARPSGSPTCPRPPRMHTS